MNIHHIGIIVKDIEKEILLFEKLGYEKSSDLIVDDIQNNKIVFMKPRNNDQTIELLEPLNENSSIKNWKKGLHHICYEIDDFDNYINKFRSLNIGKVFTGKIDAPALNNRKVAFACLTNGNIVEFLELGNKA